MTTPVAPPAHFVDLSTVKEILADCGADIESIDGKAAGETRREVADINRQLLHLADNLALASALVRNAYWGSRGEDSYDL